MPNSHTEIDGGVTDLAEGRIRQGNKPLGSMAAWRATVLTQKAPRPFILLMHVSEGVGLSIRYLNEWECGRQPGNYSCY